MTLPSADPDFDQLRMLTEISRALTYTTSLDEVTRLTVERGAALLDASSAVLLLPDTASLLHVRAAHGVSPDLLERFRAPLGEELLTRLKGILGVAEECFIAVPLIVGGEVTGVLAAAMRVPFSPADEWLLSALADQAAVAVENARLGGEVRVEMEGRLLASEGATNAKDRALATLAHDIRTPLGAIDGYCSILEDELQGPINDRQRETLGRIRMSGRHLLSLLDNVMDMARINAGVVDVSLEPVWLSEVAREAVQLALPGATARLQQLDLDIETDSVVLADPARLRQVLVNLLGNAVKFTPPNGYIAVAIGEHHDGALAWGEVHVRDSGPGIAVSEQRAVFEPYYRGEGAARTAGVGLGLAISHGLMTQMGGDLSIDSELGCGATFTVRLPAAATDS